MTTKTTKANLPFATVLTCVLLVGFGVLMVVNSGGMLSGVRRAIDTCLDTIIPSLFGFMVLSNMLIKSGIGKIIIRPLYIIFRWGFHMSEDEFLVLVLSLVGGYPVGAKLVGDNSSLLGKNAPRMLAYCYCASPAFVTGVVGLSLYGSTSVGMWVYGCNVAACLVVAAVMNFRREIPKLAPKKSAPPPKITKQIVIDSVMSAATSLVSVCAMILFFSLIQEAIVFIISPFVQSRSLGLGVVLAVLEISTLADLPKYMLSLLPLVAMLMSFGGVCIVMQVSAITRGKLPLYHFLLGRGICALLSGGFAFLVAKNVDFQLAVESFSGGIMVEYTQSRNTLGSILLLIMSFLTIKHLHSQNN